MKAEVIVAQDFSFPEIPKKTREELDQIFTDGNLDETCFESIRSLGIALAKTVSIVETSDEFIKLRKSRRYILVLGHIGKCLNLSSSILHLSSSGGHGDTVELIVNRIHINALRGLFFLNCDEELIESHIKESLFNMSEVYKKFKTEKRVLENENAFLEMFEKLAGDASLDPCGDFSTESSFPSLEEILQFLNFKNTFIENIIEASFSSFHTDYSNIINKLVKNSDSGFVLKEKISGASSIVLATAGVISSLLMKEYSSKFFHLEELGVVHSEYFNDFYNWFIELSDYCISAGMPAHKVGDLPKKKNRNVSPLASHSVNKKKIIPPLLKMDKLQLNSWANDRLPEMLWALLIIQKQGREKALSVFMRIVNYYSHNQQLKGEATFSGIAQLDAKSKFEILSLIVRDDETKEALRPLLILDCIPDQEIWNNFVRGKFDKDLIIKDLAEAIFLGLDHQSLESTDCRWLRIACMTAAGKMHFPTEDFYRKIFEYDKLKDPQREGGMIRACEGSLDGISGDKTLAWIDKFWLHCFKETACLEREQKIPTQLETHIQISSKVISVMYNNVGTHYLRKLPSTFIEPQHDTIFGIALYLLEVSREILSGPSSSILSVLGLRVLVEGVINLKYLIDKNDNELWKKFRDYGIGQVKLSVVKSREKELTHFVPFEELESIANEDRWEEFVLIDVGDWTGETLRQRSISTNLKELYEDYYIWPSSFAHTHWGAIRYVAFETCINPLHRLHRIPARFKNLKTVKYDVEILLEKLFVLISNHLSDEDLLFVNLVKEDQT